MKTLLIIVVVVVTSLIVISGTIGMTTLAYKFFN